VPPSDPEAVPPAEEAGWFVGDGGAVGSTPPPSLLCVVVSILIVFCSFTAGTWVPDPPEQFGLWTDGLEFLQPGGFFVLECPSPKESRKRAEAAKSVEASLATGFLCVTM
jgi:hypothetical protein